MKTIDQALALLLTPDIPKLVCSYDGITVTSEEPISKDVIQYCYQLGTVRKNSKSAWLYYASIPAPDGTPVVQLWWGPQYPRMARAQIRINPSTGGLSAGKFVALLALIVGSFDALDDMRVSRADCKIDFEDMSTAALDKHLLTEYARKRRVLWGTTIVINSRGGTQLIIYDLGKKLGKKPGELIRIEYRQRFKTDQTKGLERPLLWDWLGDPDDELLSGNIFKRAQLANPGILDKRTREARMVAMKGATGAYLELPPGPERKRFKKKVTRALPDKQAQLSDVFEWEAEQWHETLDLFSRWLPKIETFV